MRAGKRNLTSAVLLMLVVLSVVLMAAPASAAQCFGRRANVVGTSGADTILIDEGPGNTITATVNGVTKTISSNTVVIASLGGNDEVDVNVSQSSGGVRVYACLGGGNDNFNSVDSNKAPVVVNGGGGNDIIHGGGGNDILKGGNGADEIHGESGTDTCSSPDPAPNQGCE